MDTKARIGKLERDIARAEQHIKDMERGIMRLKQAGMNTSDEEARLDVLVEAQGERIALRIALLTGDADGKSS
jgi:hypothetical protein